jgi:PleD family two-component response regulator
VGGLEDKNVLIIDSTGHSKNLLRQLLLALGISRITSVSDTTEALATLRHQFFDVVFCDEGARRHSPAQFMKMLRSDLATTNVIVPTVLISSAARFDKVKEWRDAGGNDVIVKPVSPEVIKLRIAALILTPKAFVTTRSFIGPDRRRENERRGSPAQRADAPDRRQGVAEGTVFAPYRPADARGEPDLGQA